jgi:hypothetical protein
MFSSVLLIFPGMMLKRFSLRSIKVAQEILNAFAGYFPGMPSRNRIHICILNIVFL